MNLAYRTIQDAVSAVRTRYFPGYHMLPYNRFHADHSQHWWLSPGGEKVAYRYGKAMFTTSARWTDPGSIFCGFCVEKGVLCSTGGNSHGVIMRDWFWHRFVDLANEPFASRIEEARDGLGCNLSICVDSGIAASGAQWGHVILDVDGKDLVCRPSSDSKDDAVLATLASCTNFLEFAAAIKSLNTKERGWHWVDVLVGHAFSLDPDGPNEMERLAAMLKPFQPWMRAS
ncbi:MAG: hypothetical protein ACLQNE_29075 [Thermoguttaceae bacterium]